MPENNYERLRNKRLYLEGLIRANKAEAGAYFDGVYLLDNYVTSHWLAYRTWVAALRELNEKSQR